MSNLFTTFVIAFILFLVAVTMLAIGWLLTGKTKLKLGQCGRNPNKERDEKCGKEFTCELCKKKDDDDNIQQK